MNQKRYRSGKTTFHSSTSSSSSLYFVSFSRKKKKKLRDNFGQSIIDGWVQFTRAMYPSHDTLHNINGPEMSERIFEGKRASPVRVNTNRNAKRNEKKSVGGFFWLFERRRKIVSCDRLAIHRPTGDRSVSSGWLLCCRPHHALCAVCALCAGWSPPPPPRRRRSACHSSCVNALFFQFYFLRPTLFPFTFFAVILPRESNHRLLLFCRRIYYTYLATKQKSHPNTPPKLPK